MNQITETKTQDLKIDYLLDYAVIGAGVAGLAAASHINQQGCKVAVFDKARGTGGRMSSKRVAPQKNTSDASNFMAFDLGCVSITAESDLFASELERLHQCGAIAPWFKDDSDTIHYVGMPRNSGLTRYLSKDLECHFSTRITEIEILEGIWHLYVIENDDKTLLAKAKNIVIATPPAQAYDLLPAGTPLKSKLQDVEVDPQWVMGLQVDNFLPSLRTIQYSESDIVHSISQESYKPGRGDSELNLMKSAADKLDTLVLQVQATASWTNENLELTNDQVSKLLIAELERILERSLNVINSYSHRWLYSYVARGITAVEGFLVDDKGLYLIGDYINHNGISGKTTGIESAWISGKKLADGLMLKEKR